MHFGNTRPPSLLSPTVRPTWSPTLPAQIPVFALFAGMIALLAALPLALPGSEPARFLGGPGATLLATLAAAYGIHRWKPSPAAPWWWLTAGLALFFVGETATWAAASLGVPWSSTGIVLLSYLGYPVMAIGLFRIASAQAKVEDRSAILDALVVGAAAALNLWLVIGDRYFADGSHTADENLAMLLSLAATTLVVVLTVRLLFSLSTQLPSVVMLLGGLSALLIAGVLWASNAIDGAPVRSTGVGICFVAGYALLGLATCHESARQRIVVPADSTSELRPHRLMLLIAAAVVPPALIIAESLGWSDGRDHGVAIGITAVAISTLVFIRMFGLTTRVRDLAERRGRDRFEAMVRHSQDIITRGPAR